MTTFTSSLPNRVLEQLAQVAKDLKLPKNKIIERALEIYLEQLDRAAYTKSYKKMANDPDMLLMAEEGMAEYCKMLNETGKE
ncbi:MAG: CopG family transcriptional regulator [Marinirhabdus sp.]